MWIDWIEVPIFEAEYRNLRRVLVKIVFQSTKYHVLGNKLKALGPQLRYPNCLVAIQKWVNYFWGSGDEHGILGRFEKKSGNAGVI